ncbi:MAG: S1C family serine protease [Paludibacteraceae bacterium]|nr:S1C family serine protease [Paludibacteraceae bacterium]
MKKLIVFTIIALMNSCGGGPLPPKKIKGQDANNQDCIPFWRSLEKDDVKSVSKKCSSHQTEKIELAGHDIYEKCHNAVFIVEGDNGQGSAFFINDSGFALSNLHVFMDNKNMKAKIGSDIYTIDEVLYDENSNLDLVIIHVDLDFKNTYIPLSRDLPRIGDKVYAIGSPRGLENTLSSGEVSQMNLYEEEGLIQINVPIDHGSSGGALINQYGEAVGITTAGIDGSNANLNFALSVEALFSYLNMK